MTDLISFAPSHSLRIMRRKLNEKEKQKILIFLFFFFFWILSSFQIRFQCPFFSMAKFDLLRNGIRLMLKKKTELIKCCTNETLIVFFFFSQTWNMWNVVQKFWLRNNRFTLSVDLLLLKRNWSMVFVLFSTMLSLVWWYVSQSTNL